MPDIRLQPLPPAEAIDFFRQKGYRVGFDYRDVWRQEHQAAFTVAKAMQLDLLQDLRAGVDQALAEGITFDTFKKKLQPLLIDKGWWGRKEMVDPVTNERKQVQLGSPRRLQRIFDTNLATSYSEGQWERIQRNKGLFGFLEYVRSAAAHPRTSHLAYAGLVLSVDDPFWQRHMPVKEWGCKCTVIQHTGYSLQQQGLKVGKAPADVMRSYTNPRTGETTEVPQGVDPAFNYPPGGRRANLGRMLMEKAEAAAAQTAARVLQDGVEQWMPAVQSEFSEFVGRYARGERREVGTRRVVGVFQPKVVESLQAAGAAPKAGTVNVDMTKLNHLIGSSRGEARRAKGVGEEFVQQLPQLLQAVGEAWLDERHVVLLCVSDNELERVVKIVVDLDAPVRAGTRSNTVVSMELIDPRKFSRKGLLRLD